MAGRWRSLLQSVVLFLISIALVAGFWYHREFYRLGLIPLLGIGGFAIFVVIMVTRMVLSGASPLHWIRGELVVSVAEAEAITQRIDGAVIAPAAEELPRPGAIVRAATRAGAVAGVFRVVGAYRTILEDLTIEDLERAGYEDLAAFRKMWMSHRPWSAEDPVTVLCLRRAGGAR